MNFTNAVKEYSNLGGQGPDFKDDSGQDNPQSIRLNNVGETSKGEIVDMVVSNEPAYQPKTNEFNTLDGQGFANINMLSFSDGTTNSVDLLFEFKLSDDCSN